MASKLGKGTVSRIGLENVMSGDVLTYKRMAEERFWERWSTEKYGKYKAAMGMQIGGQAAQRGPDILKFIKQHDPDNSSGSVKDALDIMLKLQEGSTKPEDLMSTIQPLQQILGGGLYSKFMAAGSGAKKSEKIVKALEEEILVANTVANTMVSDTVQVPPPVSAEVIDIITLLIQAAEDMIPPEDVVIVTDLLDRPDIKAIKRAYYGDGLYVNVEPDMPVSFVDAINKLIPEFRAMREGATV